MQAVTLKEEKGSALVKWRLHTQFEVEKYVPTRIDVTPKGGGEWDELAAGVIRDAIVKLGETSKTDAGPTGRLGRQPNSSYRLAENDS